jgi:hypothetical protein
MAQQTTTGRNNLNEPSNVASLFLLPTSFLRQHHHHEQPSSVIGIAKNELGNHDEHDRPVVDSRPLEKKKAPIDPGSDHMIQMMIDRTIGETRIQFSSPRP